MMNVVSIERALREGVTPEQLLCIADWHDEKAGSTGRGSYKGGKKAAPTRADEATRKRHSDIADDLCRSAGRLRQARAAA